MKGGVCYLSSTNNNKNKIILILGESATGKTTVIEEIEKRYGYKSIQSYTTRPKRYEGETGHIFVDRGDYMFCDNGHKVIIMQKENDTNIKVQEIAYTYFNGNHYWADMNQVEDVDTWFYIVDKAGIDYMKSVAEDKIDFITIYITTPLLTRVKRILKRDKLKKGISRLWNDFKMFKGLEYDYKVINKDLEKSVEEVYKISKEFMEE